MQLPLLVGKKRISLEMIDFQNDDFPQKLELIVAEIQRKTIDKVFKDAADIEAGKESRDFTNLIFERFGLKIKLVCDGPIAAILPFYANKNHVFLDNLFRGHLEIKDQNKLLRSAHDRKSVVNTRNATISGFFSECESILYLDFNNLFTTQKLSVAEVVAVTLHELGHAFTTFEYSDRLETANQILTNIAKELNDKKENSDQVYIYKELKTINPAITEKEVDKLLTGNRVVAGATWFKVIIGTVQEQLTNSVYSKTSSEQLADNFCSRFHYTRPLVTALEKLGDYPGNVEKSKAAGYFSALMETLFFAVYAAGAFILASSTIPMALFVGVIVFATFRFSGEDFKDYTYDELKLRYKRIRNENVEYLKDMKLDASQVRPILDDIYLIDRIITETHRYNTPLRFLCNFVFTSAKEAKNSVVEQQLLEELAMNDLFVASAELRTINN